MQIEGLIAVAVIIVAAAAIVGLRIYKSKQANGNYSCEDFIKEYGDCIISVLKDIICILQIKIDDFNTQEEYEKAIISKTVDSIINDAASFGFDCKLVELLNPDALVEIVHDVFTCNKDEVISVLDPEEIVQNCFLYDNNIVVAASESCAE